MVSNDEDVTTGSACSSASDEGSDVLSGGPEVLEPTNSMTIAENGVILIRARASPLASQLACPSARLVLYAMKRAPTSTASPRKSEPFVFWTKKLDYIHVDTVLS